MGFRPKGPPTEPQSRFVGRKKEIGEYRQEFDLPKGQAYRLITTIYGDSGVGKTTLLRQFMTYEADRTIYSKVDEVDEPGVDLVKLIRAVADQMCLGDKRVELKTFRDTLARYDAALDKITKEAPDVPRELADLLFLGLRMVTEVARVPTAGELLERAQGPATALLDRGFDRVAALHRVTKDRQERELLQDPLRELTHALVADLNEVAGDRHKVVLMFDTYEKIGPVVDRWLLRYLLGYEEREIDFDLRLVISGREELGGRESRWWDDWGDHILSIELDPFTDEEVADFLTRNTELKPTEEVIKTVRSMTGGFPFWLDLWARGGAPLEGTLSAEHVKSVAERAMKWFPHTGQREWVQKASLYRWFDQEALAVLVGEEQAPEAFAWLTNDRTVPQDAPGGRWKTHDLLRIVMPEYVRQRSAKELAGWYAQLIEHARERLEGLEKSFSDPAEKHRSAPWREAVLDRLFYTLRAGEHKTGIDDLCQRFAGALRYSREFLAQLLGTATDATDRADVRSVTAQLEKLQEGQLSQDWASMLDGLHFLARQEVLSQQQQGIVQAWLGLGNAMMADYERAVFHLTRTIELDPNLAVVSYLGRGAAYGNLGQPERAIEDFDKAIELDPNPTMAYFSRGAAYGNLGQPERAIEDLDKAIELDPNLTMAYFGRGIAHGELGQPERAIEDFDKAIELDPNRAVAYSNRGDAYRKLGQPERAIEDFDKAIELNPNLAVAYLNRGLAYNALSQPERAIEDSDKAIEIDPNLAVAYLNRGLAYNALSQPKRAIEDSDKAIELDPNLAVAYFSRGLAYNALDQTERATEDFDKAIEIDPAGVRKMLDMLERARDQYEFEGEKG
jgi:tetratricopeptide (TPR) repeat protein